MLLAELFLSEMSDVEYSIFSKRLTQQFQAEKILLIFTRHVLDQTVYNPDPSRASMITPQIFAETFSAVLKAFQAGRLKKYQYMATKKPESHVLFKYRFTTPDGKKGIANVPCAIAKAKPPYEYKFTMITFMVKDNYQNDNFPQDSVVWL
jgi:hypothetical protein